MNKKELELAAKMLEQLSEILSNRGCNDWEFPEDWSDEEKTALIKDYHDYNGDPEEFDDQHIWLQDDSAAMILAEKIK